MVPPKSDDWAEEQDVRHQGPKTPFSVPALYDAVQHGEVHLGVLVAFVGRHEQGNQADRSADHDEQSLASSDERGSKSHEPERSRYQHN